MPNLAEVMKSEIGRLARRSLKAELVALQKAGAQYRREIAGLKRQLASLERKITNLVRAEGKRISQSGASDDELSGTRFSARSVRAQRKRLKMSAHDYGKLVGVSGQTIYSWEQGQSRPRRSQMAKLISARELGRREAMAQLAMLEASNGSSRATTSKKKRRRRPK